MHYAIAAYNKQLQPSWDAKSAAYLESCEELKILSKTKYQNDWIMKAKKPSTYIDY